MPNDSRPTKEFWDKHYKEVKEANPSYTEEQVSATVATIWKNMGAKPKSRYERMRARRKGINKATDSSILDVKHITDDMKEFDEIKDKAEGISKIATGMKAEDQVALKKKKKEKTIEKAFLFVEIGSDVEIPEGMEAIDIND